MQVLWYSRSSNSTMNRLLNDVSIDDVAKKIYNSYATIEEEEIEEWTTEMFQGQFVVGQFVMHFKWSMHCTETNISSQPLMIDHKK